MSKKHVTEQRAFKRMTALVVSDDRRLAGYIHRPAARTETGYPGVLLLHDLVGSKEQPHRMFVTLADRLAESGVVALRVDLYGRGDSEGETVDITQRGDLADAFKALYFLAAEKDVNPNRLGVVGIGWGGCLAAALAGRDERVRGAALWSCPLRPIGVPSDFREVQGCRAVDLGGSLVGEAFFAATSPLRPLDEIVKARGRVLLIRGGADSSFSRDLAQETSGALRAAGVRHELVEVADADVAFSGYPWRQAVLDATAQFLRRVLVVDESPAGRLGPPVGSARVGAWRDEEP